MGTNFLGTRKPTKEERVMRQCDIVFMREDSNGNILNIYVDLPHGIHNWNQWGQNESILIDNVVDIKDYIKNK